VAHDGCARVLAYHGLRRRRFDRLKGDEACVRGRDEVRPVCQTTGVDVHDEEVVCQQLFQALSVLFQQGAEEARIGVEDLPAVGRVVGCWHLGSSSRIAHCGWVCQVHGCALGERVGDLAAGSEQAAGDRFFANA
jgi:hypothetical protein